MELYYIFCYVIFGIIIGHWCHQFKTVGDGIDVVVSIVAGILWPITLFYIVWDKISPPKSPDEQPDELPDINMADRRRIDFDKVHSLEELKEILDELAMYVDVNALPRLKKYTED